jgi:hypothetical protein
VLVVVAGVLAVAVVAVAVMLSISALHHTSTPAAGPLPQNGRTPANYFTTPPQYTRPTVTTVPTTTTTVPTTTIPMVTGPAAVLLNYFAAINHHDYTTAWNLGAHNLDPAGYQHFVDGLRTTAFDTATITAVTGDQVHITLDALQTDNTHRYFSGYYVVVGDQIVSANMH